MTSDADLDTACAELLGWLPQVETMISEHDDDGTLSGRQPSSAPPWNSAAAWVVLDVHEGARRLEAALRLAVTGRPGRRRGGSDAATESALRAVAALGSQLRLEPAKVAAMIVERWVTQARQLPAVDESPVWRRLNRGAEGLPPKCPACDTYSLRVDGKSGVVMCFYYGCPGDRNGARPVATMEIGRVSGEPLLVWRDGLVQVGGERWQK